jgi:hypothetical protein
MSELMLSPLWPCPSFGELATAVEELGLQRSVGDKYGGEP